MKVNIDIDHVIALPNLQQKFEIETDASDYAMGGMLIQRRKPICYYFGTLTSAVRNYPTYDKELYALAHSLNK